MQSELQPRAESWSRYWATGALHSCAGSFAENYTGQIAAFWQRVFAALPVNAHVLELCSGNAPLSKLLLEQRLEDETLQIDAVDLAQAPMPWLAQLPVNKQQQLHFHAGVDAAALPFASDQYDLCISQFGVEYVGQQAFEEALRVLKPQAVFAAVIHHIDALPVQIGRVECAHIDSLLEDDGLYAHAAEMIPPMALAATAEGREQLKQSASANAVRQAFNAALQRLQAAMHAAQYPDVFHDQLALVMQLLQQVPVLGVDEAKRRLHLLREALLDAKLRQQELVAYAADEAQIRTWMQPFTDAAMTLDILRFDNHAIAGWGVVVRCEA